MRRFVKICYNSHINGGKTALVNLNEISSADMSDRMICMTNGGSYNHVNPADFDNLVESLSKLDL